MAPISFVCPRCRGALDSDASAYRCITCRTTYPIVCGIPDFRLIADPYIGMDDDRRKAEALARASAGRTFAELVEHYYAITPEDPADLAERWTAHALAEIELSRLAMQDAGLLLAPAGSALVDIGCSTGGLLVAAHRSYGTLVGVDVALRWLAVGRRRLEEAGVAATLVCASAEHLPFPDGVFQVVTAMDVIEHANDMRALLREAGRVSAAGGTLLCTANNRYWIGREPNVRLWGVGWLPRTRQASFVARRRPDLHPYRVMLPSASELQGAAADAGFRDLSVTSAPLYAPQRQSRLLNGALAAYNLLRRLPITDVIARAIGPRLRAIGRR